MKWLTQYTSACEPIRQLASKIRKRKALRRCRQSLLVAICLAIAVAPVIPANAYEGTPHVEQFVGANVGVFIKATNLKSQLTQFLDSPMARRLQSTGLYEQWLDGPDYQKLQRSRAAVERMVQMPVEEAFADFLGESAAIAIYAGSGEEPAAVLITRTTNADTIDTILDGWNRAERNEFIEHSYAGSRYLQRVKMSGNSKHAQPLYLSRLGRFLAISDREEMIRRIIDFSQLGSDDDSETLWNSAEYQNAKQLISPDTTLLIYCNPRAWDTQVGRKNDDPVFQTVWHHCRSVILGVSLQQGFLVEAIAQYDSSDLPPEWSTYIRNLQGYPEFIQRIPSRALAAFAGQHDPALFATLGKRQNLQDLEEWQKVQNVGRGLFGGLDLLDEVLTCFGSNWGMYLVPRDAQIAGVPPFDALIAFELVDSERLEAEQKQFRPALENSLTTGFHIVAAIYNANSPKETAIVRSEQESGGKIHWIDNLGPFRPAFVIENDYVVVSTALDLMTEYLANDGGDTLDAMDGFGELSDRFLPTSNQVLIFNVEAIRRFVEDSREFLASESVRSNDISPQRAADRLSRFLDVLRVCDSVALAWGIQKDYVRIVLTGIATE